MIAMMKRAKRGIKKANRISAWEDIFTNGRAVRFE